MDILGFLAFEMVRTLCIAGLQLRNQANSITKADLEKERIEAERLFKEREEKAECYRPKTKDDRQR